MSWNLAFDHPCEFVLMEPTRLADFNTQLPKSFAKADIKSDSIQPFQRTKRVSDDPSLQFGKHHFQNRPQYFGFLAEKLTRRNRCGPSIGDGHFSTDR
jgi:hypothetical protein